MIMSIVLSMAETSCARKLRNIYPLDKSWHNEKKLALDLADLAQDHPEVVKLNTIGITQAGKKPVYALQIQSGLDRIPVLIIGQHHGDEIVGVETALALATKLATDSTDAKVRDVLDRYAFWIIPTLNPEAYNIVTSGKFEWKRKNNTDTNHNKKLDLKTDGVDLNRNYPIYWNLDKNVPPASPFYKGDAPASEAEIAAIIALADLVRFRYAFFYHSSVTGALCEKIYLPSHHKLDKDTKTEFQLLRNLAESYAKAVPRDYEPGTYSVYEGNTSQVGNARNYFFHEYGTLAMDVEICGVSQTGVGIIHPTPEMRDSIVQKNVAALLGSLITD
jgi:hypothetical protein